MFLCIPSGRHGDKRAAYADLARAFPACCQFEFDKDCYVQEYVTAQFAGVETHVAIIDLLRRIQSFFESLAVEDEGDYWTTSDEVTLADHIRSPRRAPLQHFELLMRPAKGRGRKFRPSTETCAATTHLEHVLNLLREDALSGLTFAPARIVEFFSASSRANSVQYFRLSLREMFIQPMLEQWRDGPRQPQQNVPGKLRAGFSASRNDRRNFVSFNA